MTWEHDVRSVERVPNFIIIFNLIQSCLQRAHLRVFACAAVVAGIVPPLYVDMSAMFFAEQGPEQPGETVPTSR